MILPVLLSLALVLAAVAGSPTDPGKPAEKDKTPVHITDAVDIKAVAPLPMKICLYMPFKRKH